MPISIYDLTNDRKTVSIQFGVDTLNVTYRPNSLTPAREIAILRRSETIPEGDDDDEEEGLSAAQAERNIQRQLDTFIELVESWDFEGPLIVNSDGEAIPVPQDQWERLGEIAAEQGGEVLVEPGHIVPLTYNCLKALPTNFMLTIIEKINKDMRPDPKRRRR